MNYYRLTIKQDKETMPYIVADLPDVPTCLDVLKTYKAMGVKDLIEWDIIPIKKVIHRTNKIDTNEIKELYDKYTKNDTN